MARVLLQRPSRRLTKMCFEGIVFSSVARTQLFPGLCSAAAGATEKATSKESNGRVRPNGMKTQLGLLPLTPLSRPQPQAHQWPSCFSEASILGTHPTERLCSFLKVSVLNWRCLRDEASSLTACDASQKAPASSR